MDFKVHFVVLKLRVSCFRGTSLYCATNYCISTIYKVTSGWSDQPQEFKFWVIWSFFKHFWLFLGSRNHALWSNSSRNVRHSNSDDIIQKHWSSHALMWSYQTVTETTIQHTYRLSGRSLFPVMDLVLFWPSDHQLARQSVNSVTCSGYEYDIVTSQTYFAVGQQCHKEWLWHGHITSFIWQSVRYKLMHMKWKNTVSFGCENRRVKGLIQGWSLGDSAVHLKQCM